VHAEWDRCSETLRVHNRYLRPDSVGGHDGSWRNITLIRPPS